MKNFQAWEGYQYVFTFFFSNKNISTERITEQFRTPPGITTASLHYLLHRISRKHIPHTQCKVYSSEDRSFGRYHRTCRSDQVYIGIPHTRTLHWWALRVLPWLLGVLPWLLGVLLAVTSRPNYSRN